MRLALLLAYTLMLAGCSESQADPPTVLDEPETDPQDEPPPPEPTFQTVEAFNETLAYAHFATGSNEASDFLLEEGARAVRATVWVRGECPLTTYADPRVIVTKPDGSVTDVPLMPASNASLCPFVDPDFFLVEEVELSAVAGEWTVETTGDCSCEARVAVTAEVPE